MNGKLVRTDFLGVRIVIASAVGLLLLGAYTVHWAKGLRTDIKQMRLRVLEEQDSKFREQAEFIRVHEYRPAGKEWPALTPAERSEMISLEKQYARQYQTSQTSTRATSP